MEAAMSRRFSVRVLLVSGLLLTAGCDWDRGVVGVSGESPQATVLTAGPHDRTRTPDGIWADLARREIPGFAGHYVDPSGTSVILIKDVSRAGAAVEYVRNLELRHLPTAKPATVREVRFDFAELSDWRNALLERMPVGDVVTYVDLDEVANAVHLGM